MKIVISTFILISQMRRATRVRQRHNNTPLIVESPHNFVLH